MHTHENILKDLHPEMTGSSVHDIYSIVTLQFLLLICQRCLVCCDFCWYCRRRFIALLKLCHKYTKNERNWYLCQWGSRQELHLTELWYASEATFVVEVGFHIGDVQECVPGREVVRGLFIGRRPAVNHYPHAWCVFRRAVLFSRGWVLIGVWRSVGEATTLSGILVPRARLAAAAATWAALPGIGHNNWGRRSHDRREKTPVFVISRAVRLWTLWIFLLNVRHVFTHAWSAVSSPTRASSLWRLPIFVGRRGRGPVLLVLVRIVFDHGEEARRHRHGHADREAGNRGQRAHRLTHPAWTCKTSVCFHLLWFSCIAAQASPDHDTQTWKSTETSFDKDTRVGRFCKKNIRRIFEVSILRGLRTQ